jgi:hypothetical protein
MMILDGETGLTGLTGQDFNTSWCRFNMEIQEFSSLLTAKEALVQRDSVDIPWHSWNIWEATPMH